MSSFPLFIDVDIIVGIRPIRSLQSISPGFVKTNITKNSKELADLFDKVPSLVPEDIADALIYALGTRPEVQVQIIVNALSTG